MCRDLGKRPLLDGSDSEAESVNSSVAPSPQGSGGVNTGRASNPSSTSSGAPSPSGPWRLVITGHSLGAGIAAFAGLFLHTLYPGVRVFCYSPPAWLMTPELSRYSERFVTSVVINKDLFSRCTLFTSSPPPSSSLHAVKWEVLVLCHTSPKGR